MSSDLAPFRETFELADLFTAAESIPVDETVLGIPAEADEDNELDEDDDEPDEDKEPDEVSCGQ